MIGTGAEDIGVPGIELYDSAVSRETASMLYQSYSIFSLLEFVKNSNLGILGLYSMMLLLLLMGTWFLHISYIWKALRNRFDNSDGKGMLRLYVTGKAAMLLTILLVAGSYGFVLYSNRFFGMKGFAASPLLAVELIGAMAAYAAIKKLEAVERIRCHEHGLVKEFRKNWVLFLMLLPVGVFFLVNSYLPMVGIYFAFVNFNFADGLWASPFVGLKNLEFLFQSQMGRLIRNTVLYNVVFIVLGNVLQIFFAVLVSQMTVKWFKKVGQTLIFMPYFVSFVLLKVMVYSLLEYQCGAINNMIRSSGGTPIDFYNSPIYWPFLITLFNMWKSVGYGMVVYLATMLAGCGDKKTADSELGENYESSSAQQSEESQEESSDTAEESPKESSAEPEGGAAGELDYSEHVDLVFYLLGDAPVGLQSVQDAINEILEEKVNASVEFQFSTWTDWGEKYKMTLTTGGADLIYTANWSSFGQLAQSGAFLGLDDLLDTVSPDLKAAISPEALNGCKVNGEVMTVPCLWKQYTCGGIEYREDLREKYDLPVPDSLENLKAYLHVLRPKL